MVRNSYLLQSTSRGSFLLWMTESLWDHVEDSRKRCRKPMKRFRHADKVSLENINVSNKVIVVFGFVSKWHYLKLPILIEMDQVDT